MPKVKEVIQWYTKNGWPLVCRYCGSDKNLTKDHVKAKSKTPQRVRLMRWRNRDRDPHSYFSQFVLCCGECNRMKGCMTHEQFLEHTHKIINYIKQ